MHKGVSAETPAYAVCHPGLVRQVLTDFKGIGRTGLVYARIRTAMGMRTDASSGGAGRGGHAFVNELEEAADRRRHLALAEEHRFGSGAVYLCYRPA